MALDSGSIHCTDHYDDLLKSIISKYNEQIHNGNLILRTDSGFGSAKNVEKLLSITNLKFVTKGYSSVKAKNLAKNISYSEYDKADEVAWVYELSQINKVRYIKMKSPVDKEPPYSIII